eukprot:s1215_g23.t1
MKRRVGRRSSTFPLREGDFAVALRGLKGMSLEDSTKEEFVSEQTHTAWAMLACFACQTLDSGFVPFMEGNWKSAERRMVNAVEETTQRMAHHGLAAEIDPLAVEKELKRSRVAYDGEELGVCHKLTFDQVVPALPPREHGGAINILDFVSESTRSLLQNPAGMVVEDLGQELPKLQGKVHIEKGDVEKIARELVERGVCRWIPYSEVAEFRNQKVLNGLFGVEKSGKVINNKPILRLIMNLVPSNSVLKQFKGATKRLPHITSWLSTYIEDGEELRIWQSDMANAFYLFRLPEAWQRFLAFNIVRRKSAVMPTTDESLVCLSCCVLPMGWGSSVSIMQEVSEQLLEFGSLPRSHQIVRGLALPVWMTGLLAEAQGSAKAWWHIYLDNFAAGQVGKSDDTFDAGHDMHREAERLWSAAGVVSADKKRKTCEPVGQELGAHLDGVARTMGPSPDRMLKLIQGTLVMLQRRSLSRKVVQVMAGRWIHVFQFRRPAMSFLETTWEYIGSKGMRIDLQRRVRREFFACLCALPLLHTFLGARIVDGITASDASHYGGAVGQALQLSTAGEDFVRASLRGDHMKQAGIMVISLFHGIGGSFRCYDILGIKPAALIAFDIHKPALRVTSRRWPHAELFGDVRSFHESLVENLLLRYPGISEVHLWGGFPCIDLSSVNSQGRGLAGPQSSLFYELLRILKMLRKKCPGHVTVKFVAENVASMAKTECEKISKELGTQPYHLNCADAVPMQRPRLCWTSEPLEDSMDGLETQSQPFWVAVTAEATYPLMTDWIAQGTCWPGGEQGYTLPTALKSIERKRPPPSPAGYHRNRIPLSWRLFKVWRKIEAPNRAPPLTQQVVEAWILYAIDHRNLNFAAMLALGFFGLLRTGEFLQIRPVDLMIGPQSGIISLKNTKTGLRNAAQETVSITNTLALEVLRAAIEEKQAMRMQKVPIWVRSAQSFRTEFRHHCKVFDILTLNFRPYSLRRGGATALFQETGSMEAALLKGRWSSSKVAKIYLADGLSYLPGLSFSPKAKGLLDVWSIDKQLGAARARDRGK